MLMSVTTMSGTVSTASPSASCPSALPDATKPDRPRNSRYPLSACGSSSATSTIMPSRDASMATSSANVAPARNPAHSRGPAGRAGVGANSCEIECRNCAWTYDRRVCGGGSSRGGFSGWQARRLARRHLHHPRGRRFGGRPGLHGAAHGPRSRRSSATRRWCCASAATSRRSSPAASSARSSSRRRPSARVVESLRKAKVDRRITSVVIRPTGTAALWGKVQEVRDAIVDFKTLEEADHRVPRVRRRAGVLPRQRLRQGLPDADRVARPDRHRQLRAVPARHARQDRRVSRRAAHRRLQDGGEHVHRAHLHAGAPRDGGVAEHAISTSSWCTASPTAATSREAEVRALIDHGPFLPEDAVRAGLVDDVAYEDELDDKVALGDGARRSSSSTTTTAASRRPRSA